MDIPIAEMYSEEGTGEEPSMEQGVNPINMSMPDGQDYQPPSNVESVPYEEMPELLQEFMDEHEEFLERIDEFEEAMLRFKENKWVIDEPINESFSQFFTMLDNQVLAHNRREEKTLFPILHEELLESGEHSQFDNGDEPRTAVDVMEDEHIKCVQLSALVFNFLGLAQQLPDVQSQSIVSDLAFEQGQSLIETLRLHIRRENGTLFPLACQFMSSEEFETIGTA